MPQIDESTTVTLKLLHRSKRRTLAIVFIFCLWSLLVVARLSQVMVFDRDDFLLDMNESSWRTGVIPAVRGRILDIDGRPLAWSTRQFVLSWSVPQSRHLIEEEFETLDESFSLRKKGLILTDAIAAHGETMTLRNDLSPAEFSQAAKLRRSIPGIAVQSVFTRHTHPNRKVAERLGKTRLDEGMEVGYSGEELLHDSLLRGRPGMYRVMVNASGGWLPETWEKVRELEPGYDVYIPMRVPPSHTQEKAANNVRSDSR